MDISTLLVAAKSAAGAKSDRELGDLIGVFPTAISGWRTNRYFPSDENIVSLCLIAGIEPELGLLSLNMWRSGERARAIYGEMAHRLRLDLAEPPTRKSA